MSVSQPASAYPDAPAPWTLDGEGWTFPLYTAFSDTPIPVPEATYGPLEKGSEADQSARFYGGVGTVMLVRYASSPVGPYDELLYVPGLFSRKDGKEDGYHMSVTRIYVSEDASTMNGRRNWGIPKHRAIFNWTPQPSGRLLVTVALPSSPSSPFFRALLVDSRTTPLALPVSTTWLDWRVSQRLMGGYGAELFQPRLPGVDGKGVKEETVERLKEMGQDPSALVGSETAISLKLEAKGWVKVAKLEVAPSGEGEVDWSGFGDGVGFPRFTPAVEGPLKGRGVHFSSFRMVFPVGTPEDD
ncbi:hypothetical protein JCM10207_008958 [Rhodosporidiobolus poonsookiae]